MNIFIATISNFGGYNRSISELLKFAVCAGINTVIIAGIDIGINHLIPDPEESTELHNQDVSVEITQ